MASELITYESQEFKEDWSPQVMEVMQATKNAAKTSFNFKNVDEDDFTKQKEDLTNT